MHYNEYVIEQFPRKITTNTLISFSTGSFGLYAVRVTARCHSAKQSDSGKNETLRLEIDDMGLREIPPTDKPQYNKIPSTWNGTDLKGLAKTIVFIVVLNKGNNIIQFIPTNGAVIEKWDFQQIENPKKITFLFNDQAEDGDRRPWYTFALVHLPLQSFSVEASVSWHFFDGDDVKLIVDGDIETNNSSRLWKYWAWSAKPWQILFGPKRGRKDFTKDLPQETHYIEFFADRTPTLHQVILNLGSYQPKRIPTVDDPEWTKNFEDDTEYMILARALFGEVRDTSYPDKARIAVGWSIRNRVEDSRWPDTYQEVITKPFQYSAFNSTDPNREYVENPLFTGKEIDRKAWQKAYAIAGKVIRNEIDDPTSGANHYHDSSIKPPSYLTKETLVLTIPNNRGTKSLFFYRL